MTMRDSNGSISLSPVAERALFNLGVRFIAEECKRSPRILQDVQRGLTLEQVAEEMKAEFKVMLQQVPESISTKEVVDAFLKAKASTVSEKSVESYRHTLNVLVEHCPILPSTPEEIEQYLSRVSKRTGKPISKRSAAGYHTVLAMLYKFAKARYDLPNVMEKVDRPGFKNKEPHAFTLEETRAIINEATKNEAHLALIHLYLGHGWRLEEGVRANVGDISNGEIMVRGKKRNEYMPLLPETKELLVHLGNGRKPDEPLFLSQMKGRLSTKQAYNVGKAILQRSGALEGKPADLRIATHTLRKTFATLMMDAGCEGRIVQRLLRHEKRDVTDLYLHIPKERLRQALEQYSPLKLLNGNQSQVTAKLPKISY